MDHRQQTIRRTILEKLELAEPYALPEDALQTGVNASVRPPLGQAEFDDALTFLQSQRFVRTLPDDLDPDLVKFLITESGKTLLLK
jgi:regulator of protease activity HflC (stomatin/prohibitin superfamily)